MLGIFSFEHEIVLAWLFVPVEYDTIEAGVAPFVLFLSKDRNIFGVFWRKFDKKLSLWSKSEIKIIRHTI